MLRKTQSSSRIHGVVLILIIGFIGTLAALAEQYKKESDLQIPPRRQNETTAAYNRSVSVARNAAAARRAATVRAGTSPQQDAGQDKVYLDADKRANSILTGGTDQQGGPINPMMRGQGQGRRMRRMQQGQNQGPGMGPMMGGPGQGRGMGRMMGGPGRGRGMGRMMGGPGQGCMPGQNTCCGCQCCQK
jgi:hypothetical protein